MRERQGLTLKDLAARTETAGDRIDVSALCRYENGCIMPTAPRLRTLASALDCTIDDLLTPTSEDVAKCA